MIFEKREGHIGWLVAEYSKDGRLLLVYDFALEEQADEFIRFWTNGE